MQERLRNIEPAVRVAMLAIMAFITLNLIFPASMSQGLAELRVVACQIFGFSQTIVVNATFIFLVALAALPFGRKRFGKDTDRPEFSNTAWLSMLFGSGLGVGFIFWSVAEPLSYAHSNPYTTRIVEDAHGSSDFAIALTMYHWGAYTQSVYGVVAVALGLACYRRGLPFRLASLLYPLIGDRAYGRIGTVAESVTLIATVLGLATSLGLGGQALGSSVTGGGSETLIGAVVVVCVISLLSFFCVVRRLSRFVRLLSLTTSALLVLIALSVLLAGPTGSQFELIRDGGIRYIELLPQISFLDPAFVGEQWQHDWSLAYWGWWIAWAPFVGTFYARVSKGRTVRELIIAILIAPTLGGLCWIGIFGGAAFGLDAGMGDALIQGAVAKPASAVFALLEALDFGAFGPVIVLAMMLAMICLGAQSMNAGVIGMRLLIGGDGTVGHVEAFGWVSAMAIIALLMISFGGTAMVMSVAFFGGLLFTPIYIAGAISLAVMARNDRPLVKSSGKLAT